MTAAASPRRPAPAPAHSDGDFQLVESSAGWQLTVTLTDRLREALARGGPDDSARFTVRVAPNLVPGEPFEARLVIQDAG
jgi:hypothetical protein